MDQQKLHKFRFGRKGEKLARRFLKKLGYRHVKSNYTVHKCGEIDLVMRQDTTVVFVEVKTQQQESFASGELLVNSAKRRRLYDAARHFIREHNLYEVPWRFDVVVIVIPPGEKPSFRHYENAFGG
ncbi:MAG: YraN family protein [Sedimentisphaerales bacterium]|nr:YraN family protein [Sedimentisphaerales bacterium]